MIEKVSKSAKVIIIPVVEDIDKFFPEEYEVHVYRIIQEAISNIIKHSNSSEAIIKITNNKESVSILISDNGKGFDADNVKKGSLGLSGISERVKILGGTMSIESKRGEGNIKNINTR
ncbi:MAG: hypothetical protein IPL53_14150 [Ignavibacteria bacterium]|nr:hypothetical protein [Ignavibacteria bacterium]